ncbi:unnamed protein product [Penicillium olsonii]|nr:unnamed protein product [Penicillium olsonii]
MSEIVKQAFSGRDRPSVSYGIPFPEAASRHLRESFQASRVYVICSQTLARTTNVMDRLSEALGSTLVGHRAGMKSHTLWSEVLQITEETRTLEADAILTVGAGSLTDGAKIVALALANGIKTAEELRTLAEGPDKRSHITAPQIPIVSVPTSLSAGEFSDFAGGTEDDSKRKFSFQPPTRGPQLVIFDSELVKTTPNSIWLSTGVRAIDHCVESMCAVQGTSEASDKLAKHALGLLVSGLLRRKKSREDRDAYLQCQLGSIDAMAACTSGSIQLGASHGIGHQLGPLGVGHGETSCILLPAVCKFNAKYKANCKQQENLRLFLIEQSIVSELLRTRSVDVETSDLGDILDVIIRELGMPRSLADVHVGQDKLNELAANSLHDRWCKTNPIPLTKHGQVLEILEMVV